MKGDATTHTTNAAYRAGWERVFGPRCAACGVHPAYYDGRCYDCDWQYRFDRDMDRVG